MDIVGLDEEGGVGSICIGVTSVCICRKCTWGASGYTVTYLGFRVAGTAAILL